MMENRSFDHYFGWHPEADAQERGPHATRTPTATRSTRYRLTPDFQGCGHPRSRPRLGRRTLAVERRPQRPLRHRQRGGHRERRVRDRLLPRRRTSRSSRTPPTPTRSMTAGSARSWRRPTRTATTSGAPRTAARSPTSSRSRPAGPRLHLGDDLRPRARRTGSASATTTRTSPSRRSTARAASAWTRPIAAVLRRRRRREPAEHLLRRPAVPRRRRRQRPLGRRASARRHPPRPGVHVRRRPRLHRVAAVPARARCSSTTTSGAASSTTSRRRSSPTTARNRADINEDWGLDRLPHPRASAISPFTRGGRRQPHAGHPRVDPEADLLPLRPRLPEQAPPLRDQHRPQLQLAQPGPRAPVRCPTRTRRGDAVLAAVQRAGAAAPEAARPRRARDLGLPRPARLRGPDATLEHIFRYPDTIKKGVEEGNRKGAAALGG